jgi:Cu/Zn superoxide dismutase
MTRALSSPLPRLLVLAGSAVALSACGMFGGGGGGTPNPRGSTARATFVNAQGQPAGTATLTSTGDGVFISAQLRSLPEGTHAIHVHQTGRCEPPFESAGAHFNPNNREHGYLNPAGQHAGDLPNITVRSDGTAVAVGYAGGLWEDVSPRWLVGRNIGVHGFFLDRLMSRQPDLVERAARDALRLWESGAVRPIVGAEFPLEQAADAHRLIESRQSTGKVVLIP